MSRRTGRERMPPVGARRIAVGAGGWVRTVAGLERRVAPLRAADLGADDTSPEPGGRSAARGPARHRHRGGRRRPATGDCRMEHPTVRLHCAGIGALTRGRPR